MGTRADFYVGRGKSAEWIGSIAYDGYPDGIDENILNAHDEGYYRQSVNEFLNKTRDEFDCAIFPEEGWPWPWDDSCTTDYAYAFDGNMVYASCFGHKWFNPLGEEYCSGYKVDFPNMKDIKNIQFGSKSGMMVIGVRED